VRLSPAQALVLRLGAVLLSFAAVVLVVVALSVEPTDPGGGELEAVDDSGSFTLPRLGVFGGETVVYGVAEGPAVPAADLGCRLLSEGGNELSTAKMSHLKVLGRTSAELAGTRLEPLFAVSSYPSGASLSCADAEDYSPLAVAEPSTFGDNAGLVRATAVGGAVACLLVAVVAWLLGSRRRP
jgi:hypothetical protein